jgi:hypothetical protein
MPKYALEVGGKTYDIESDKPLSDSDLASYASQISASSAQSRGTVPDEPRSVGGFLSNIGPSAKKFVGGIAEAIANPVQTAGSLLDVAAGGLQKALPRGAVDFVNSLDSPEGQAAAQRASNTASAVGGHYAQRYGSIEGIKKAAYEDPVGVAGDVSALLSMGAGAIRTVPTATQAGFKVAKAVPAFSQQTALTTMPQQIAAIATPTANALEAAARYTNPLQPVASSVNALGALAGKAAQYGAGFSTGLSKEPFSEAFTAGKKGAPEFAQHMRGKVAPEELLNDVKQGLANMQNEMSASYATAKTGWAADATPLDFGKIDAAFNKLESTTQHAGKSLVGKEEASKIAEVRSVLDEWRADPSAHNAIGFDALKRRIDAIYPDSPKQSQAQRIISGTRNAVKNEIVAQVPEYASAMKGYEESLSLIRDIEKGLSAGDKAAKTTALQKLQSMAKGKFADKYRQELISKLEAEGGVSLKPAIAGQALSDWSPTGFGRLGAGLGAGAAILGSTQALAALPLTSPRVMGELFYGAGRAAGGANALARKTGINRITPEQINYFNSLLQAQQAQGRQ